MNRLGKLLLALLLLAPQVLLAQTASLLPNGMQQFVDENGAPYASGSVYFYLPNTTTFKGTWKDPGQVVANTNPVVLDASGRATIYGAGQYRQVLLDVNGNTIWDQLTYGAGGSFAGAASGLAPSYSIALTILNYNNQTTFSWSPNFTSVGNDTLNVNGLGARPLYKASTAGIVRLGAGDLQINSIVLVQFNTALNGGNGGWQVIGGGSSAAAVGSVVDASEGGLCISPNVGAVLVKLCPSDLATKPTPVGTDLLAVGDSAAGFVAKGSTIAQVVTGVASTKAQMQTATNASSIVTPSQVQNNPGVAQAWADFAEAGGGATVNASWNVTSVVRNGAGDYTINFTVPFATVNYGCLISAGEANTTNVRFGTAPWAAKAQGSYRILSTSSGGIGTDVAETMVVCWGAQ